MQVNNNLTSFVIISYNNYQAISKCIKSIIKQTGNLKIIVIDNNSEIECLNLVKKIDGIELIENTRNLGFGKACNQGIELAIKFGSPYIYLLNQDAWLDNPSHLTKLLAGSSASKCAIISPLQLDESEEFEHNFLAILKKYKVKPNPGGNRVLNIDFINATAWFMKINEIKTRFDPDFFMYGEDYHFAKEIHSNHLRIGIFEGCTVYHNKDKKYEDDLSVLKLVEYGFLLSEWKIPKWYKSKFVVFGVLVKKIIIKLGSSDGWAWYFFKCGLIFLFGLYKYRNSRDY